MLMLLLLLKDVEVASDLRIDLDAKYSSLKNDLEFVTKTQDEVLTAKRTPYMTLRRLDKHNISIEDARFIKLYVFKVGL